MQSRSQLRGPSLCQRLRSRKHLTTALSKPSKHHPPTCLNSLLERALDLDIQS